MNDEVGAARPRPAVADRFSLQLSWWHAAEIARRQGDLLVSRVEDAESYALIIVHDGPTGRRVQFDLTSGALWEDVDGARQRLSWRRIVTADDAHRTVALLEAGAGFPAFFDPAPMNRRTVVYCVAAALLAAKINDARAWQLLPAPLVGDKELVAESIATLRAFPSMHEQLEYAFGDIVETAQQARILGRAPYWHEPFWLVMADLEVVMVLDEAGYVHLPGGVFLDLLALFDALGGDIAAVVGVMLSEPDIALSIADMVVPDEETR